MPVFNPGTRGGPVHAAYKQVWDLAAMIGLEAGDELEFDHIGDGTLRVRKLKM